MDVFINAVDILSAVYCGLIGILTRLCLMIAPLREEARLRSRVMSPMAAQFPGGTTDSGSIFGDKVLWSSVMSLEFNRVRFP